MRRFDRITWNPNQMNGQPCIRGMRLTVRRIVEAVALYPNRDDLFRNYPELEPEDLQQALAFAAARHFGSNISGAKRLGRHAGYGCASGLLPSRRADGDRAA